MIEAQMDKYILRRAPKGYQLFGVREMGRKQVLGSVNFKGVIALTDTTTVPADIKAATVRRTALEAAAKSSPHAAKALDLADRIANLCLEIETATLQLDETTTDLLIKAAYDLRSTVVTGTIDAQRLTASAEDISPEYHLDLALHLVRQNKNTEALAALKQAEALGYSNRSYLNEIKAGICLSLNDQDGSFDALSLACAGAASPARPARALLPRYLKKGYGDAFSKWLVAFSDGVKQSWVHNILARIAEHDGDTEGAVEQNLLALKLDPTSLTAARALVDSAFRTGDMDLARKTFALAAANAIDAAHMQNALARLRMDEKDFAAAMEASAKAIALEPENSNFWFIRGVSLRRGGALPEAFDALQTAVSLNPSAAFSYYNLSLCAAQLSHPDIALSAAQKALELAPNNQTFLAQLTALGAKPAQARAATAKSKAKQKPASKTAKPSKPKNANWPRLG